MTVKALGGERVEDLHSYLDEFRAKGCTKAILVAIYDDPLPIDDDGDESQWEAVSVGGSSCAERAFIYQQLIILEISKQEAK